MGRATDLFQKEPPTPSGNVAVEFNPKKVDITVDANVCQHFLNHACPAGNVSRTSAPYSTIDGARTRPIYTLLMG